MAVRLERDIYKVLSAESKSGAGQASGVVKTKLLNIASGRVIDPHFRPDERLEDLTLTRQAMEFLYAEADVFTFMNPETFEQVEISGAALGNAALFLKESMRVPVEFFEGRPVSIIFPDTVEARVVETAAPVHSAQDNTLKQALLDNGLKILVPVFIATNETVRVEVATGRYLGRVHLAFRRSA